MNTQEQNKLVLTIGQLTNAIKLCLEGTFPLVWAQGEISNFKKQASGHLYFSLKDAEAQIGAVMFRGDASALKLIPKDGDKVIVKAELNVYAQSGKYQLLVREIKLVGLGELLLKLEELKGKIHKKGWFRQEHKKPIPKIPKRIGVVTSPTGAVIQDILNVLTRRFSGFHLILNPVKVQGDGAAKEIAEAIKQFNDYDLADVLIIGRGGGSIEDLWAFNEEIVAEAIFNSRIPIISAVGHETDHCIADYVADVRAPTPSAAAEMVIAEKAQQLQHIAQMQRRLKQTLMQMLKQYRQKMNSLQKSPIMASPYYLLGPWMQKLDYLRTQIDQAILNNILGKKNLLKVRHQHVQSLKPTVQILHFRQKLFQLNRSLNHVMRQRITYEKQSIKSIDISVNNRIKQALSTSKERLDSISTTLKAIDPRQLLTKGYSILFSEKDGSVIKSVHHLKKDDDIRIMLADGEALSTIKEVIKK